MPSFYRSILALATVLAAASCAAPDTAETSPPYEEQAGGGSGCTLGAVCTSGGMQGHCALSPTTGAHVCCTGCVDSGGVCRAGVYAYQCGGSGHTCVECSIPNGSPACIGGTCQIGMCNSGWEDCDGSIVTGCETDVSRDPLNCGGCLDVCGAGQSCISGECN